MTNEEAVAASNGPQWRRVLVKANDYSYEGWLVIAFSKRRKTQLRCVVEDENGRLFIHNPSQLTSLT